MSPELAQLALGVNRVVTYGSYVLLAGTFAFWSLVWPEGRRDRRLVRLAVVGTTLMVVGTVADPVIRLALGGQALGEVVTPLSGAALLVRLAALAATAFFLVDLVRSEIRGWRRVFAIVVVAVIAGSMVVQTDAVGGRWELLKVIATSGHVLATAAWLGGLVALAAVLMPRANPAELDRLIPRANLAELDRLIPRFSRVALFSVITLVITGTVHALAVAGGMAQLADSRYGLVLLIKIGVFGAMLLLGHYGRKYAARVAFRRVHHQAEVLKNSRGEHSLAVVMGAELVIAFAILATTSVLVMVAPS